MAERDFSRRDFLKLFGLVGVEFVTGACSSPSSVVSTNMDVKPTVTAVPVGGSESDAPKSRYDQLLDKIAKGQAPEADIKEFNQLTAERNTVTIWTTEKGETRQLPKIEGLRAIYFASNNKLEIVYSAQENNVYELKVGAIGGLFNPNVYNIDAKDGIETKNQVGAIILRSEIVTYNHLLTIPIDPTPAPASADRRVFVQISKNSSEGNLAFGQAYTYLTVPAGSQFIQSESNLIGIERSFEGVAFKIGGLEVKYGGKLPEGSKAEKPGDPLFAVATDSALPYGLRLDWTRSPKIMGKPQFEILGETLRIDGSFVFTASNQNPALSK